MGDEDAVKDVFRRFCRTLAFPYLTCGDSNKKCRGWSRLKMKKEDKESEVLHKLCFECRALALEADLVRVRIKGNRFKRSSTYLQVLSSIFGKSYGPYSVVQSLFKQVATISKMSTARYDSIPTGQDSEGAHLEFAIRILPPSLDAHYIFRVLVRLRS